MFGFERCCFEFDNHIGVQLDIVENEVDSKCFCCATKAKPLPQSQPASAKLGYSFEELCFWCFKLKFLSGSTIDFLLYTRNLFIGNFVEVGLFGNILSDEFVCGKFKTVVSGYGLDVFLVGQQQTSDRLGQRLGLLPMGKFGHEEHVCGTLLDCEYGVVVSIRYQIHLKIPKAFSGCLLGTQMDASSIGNGEMLVFGSAPIFELMTRVACQFPACISMD